MIKAELLVHYPSFDAYMKGASDKDAVEVSIETLHGDWRRGNGTSRVHKLQRWDKDGVPKMSMLANFDDECGPAINCQEDWNDEVSEVSDGWLAYNVCEDRETSMEGEYNPHIINILLLLGEKPEDWITADEYAEEHGFIPDSFVTPDEFRDLFGRGDRSADKIEFTEGRAGLARGLGRAKCESNC